MPLYPPVPTATSSVAGIALLDGTATDITPAGVQAAGAVGKTADAGHVHPWASAEPLASGEAIFPRMCMNSSVSTTLGVLLITYWTAATSGTATTVTTSTGGTAGSVLTYAAVGIYSVAANGDLTKLTDTGDLHASLWASTYTVYASSLSPSFTRVAGTRYAIGVLTTGTTAPSLLGNNFAGGFTTSTPLAAGTNGSGLTSLPSSVAHGSISGGYNAAEAIVAP